MKKISVCLAFWLIFVSVVPALMAGEADPVLKEILQALKTYQHGINDDLILKLNDFIRDKRKVKESREACENELLLFLASDITPTAGMEACRQLRIIGSDRSVPVLAKMLLKKNTTDMARYALEKIPGKAAQETLLKALAQSSGDIRLGLISSLGQRREPGAVLMLSELLSGSDKCAAKASARALGRIPDPRAVEVLSRSLNKSGDPLRMAVASVLLNCAERYLSQKDKKSAVKLYNKVLGSPVPLPLRRAAMRGKITASGDAAGQLILDVLRAEDKAMYGPAIGMIRHSPDQNELAQICSLLLCLPEENQVQLIMSLADYKEPKALSAVTEALKSGTEPVRIAALMTLSRLGNAASVDFLVNFAAGAKGKEQAAARAGLWGLAGPDVDAEILSRLSTEPEPRIRIELTQCIGERRIYQGKDLLFKEIFSEYTNNRLSAVRALKLVAVPDDLPCMLKALLKLEQNFEQMEMATVVAVVAGRILNAHDRAADVEWMLETEENTRFRGILLRVLGKIGDDSSLYLLRNAMQDNRKKIVDAAVRALADWPQFTARDDVLGIARTSENPVHRVLALRAYVRLIGTENFRKPESVVASLKEALSLSTRPEEKILILGLLPNFVCPDGLKLAETLLADKAVKAEAEMAVKQIRRRLQRR